MLRERLDGWAQVVFVNVLLFAPYFNARVMYPDFALDKIVVLFCLSFAGVLLLSRAVYLVLAVLLLFVNVVYLHITLRWGLGFEDRVSQALESPGSERLEYLTNYLSGTDALIGLYVLICLAAIGFIVKFRKRSNLFFRVFALAPVLLVLTMVSSNSRAMKMPFITLPLELYERPVRAQRLAERGELVTSIQSTMSCSASHQNLVVVIGESSSADHNALYGYARAGASRLDGLGFTRFAAIAPSNQTRYSVPMMLTRATAENFDSFYREPSLVTELKACGYRTYWLSNQPKAGKYDDNVAAMSREADIRLFLVDEGDGRPHYDEELVAWIRLINGGARPSEKRAYFVHLAGSHFDYNKRFPESFSRERDNMRDAYDVTVQYTDRVLRGLFDVFSRDSLLFLYASDHGELFIDEQFGHGYVPSYQNEYRVPFLVWSSDAERLSRLQEYVGSRVINTESFDDIVRFLAGMGDEPPQVSFSRQVMDASRRVVDYDGLSNVAPDAKAPALVWDRREESDTQQN